MKDKQLLKDAMKANYKNWQDNWRWDGVPLGLAMLWAFVGFYTGFMICGAIFIFFINP